jgi:uncharacterized protein (TIGR03067 family)
MGTWLQLRIGFAMRTTTILLLAILALGADAPQAQADKELDRLQGEWGAISFEANGDSASTANAGWKVIVKGRKVSVRFGAVSFDGNLVLGSTGQRRRLDVVEIKWGETPVRMELSGIYKLEQATLTVCYRFGTQAPPSEFRTAMGADTMIQVFKQTK